MMDKYILDTPENIAFTKQNAKELLEFGKNFPSPSGASYYLGDDGSPWKDRPCETWITCRMAHVYSIGSLMGIKGCDELAAKAIKGLKTQLFDKENGGWYSAIDAQGKCLGPKMCYAHAFVMLASSSAVLAGIEGAKELLNCAIETFKKYFWDEEYGMTRDGWDLSFKELDTYRGINGNMHSTEALLACADVLCDDSLKNMAGRIVKRVVAIAAANDYRLPEHFDENWKEQYDLNRDNPSDQFKPYGATPGHGMEWARLIIGWAKYSTSESEYREYVSCACKLYDRAVSDAWRCDGEDGFVYTTDFKGAPVVHDRMHWVEAEAVNTSAVLYRVTKENRYKKDYEKFLKFMDEKFKDIKNGSYFHQLDRNNKPLDTVWPGKPDLYHVFQSMLVPYIDEGYSIAYGVKKREEK